MVKTIKLRAIDLYPGLSLDKDGIPFRHLTSLVEKVRALVPDNEETSCVVTGAAGLNFVYEHELTPLEESQDMLERLRGNMAEVSALLPREGPITLTEDQVRWLKDLLGR